MSQYDPKCDLKINVCHINVSSADLAKIMVEAGVGFNTSCFPSSLMHVWNLNVDRFHIRPFRKRAYP